MHLAAYAARPDAWRVVHAHPVTAVAFTVAGLPPGPATCVPEAAVTLGPVAVAPFATPGTAEVPASLAPFLPGHDVLLLARHGALCLGATVDEAVDRMETLERVARSRRWPGPWGAASRCRPGRRDGARGRTGARRGGYTAIPTAMIRSGPAASTRMACQNLGWRGSMRGRCRPSAARRASPPGGGGTGGPAGGAFPA